MHEQRVDFPEEGYLYICLGARYVTEACRSAKSLRLVDPNASITLIADSEPEPGIFDHVSLREWQGSGVEQALLYRVTHMYSSPYKKTFFLDSDTYFCDSCRELFDLLDFFDLCLAPALLESSPVMLDGKELTGCQIFNMGVVVFKKNPSNQKLFSDWTSIFSDTIDKQHDQSAFMTALLNSASRVCTISNNYNARICFVQAFTPFKVKLIHARGSNLAKFAERINEKQFARVWVPGINRVFFRTAKGLRGWLQTLFSQLHPKTRKAIKRATGFLPFS